MVAVEGNIRSEAPDLNNRYCSHPAAEETGRTALEKGPGCSRDRRLDGPEQDTLVADPVVTVSVSFVSDEVDGLNPRICLPL